MKLIVNADDLGSADKHNEAIFCSLREGFCSTATIMANMPGFAAAAHRVVKEHLPVGIHINLCEGIPLSDPIRKCARFCDTNGEFLTTRGQHVYLLNAEERKAVVGEIGAQIRTCREAGLNLTHADSHTHIHEEPGLTRAFISTVKAAGIPYLRMARNTGPQRSMLNVLYRRYVNGLIRAAGLSGADAFGNAEDYLYEVGRGFECNHFEIMTHPRMTDGEIRDISAGLRMEETARLWSKTDLVSFADLAADQ